MSGITWRRIRGHGISFLTISLLIERERWLRRELGSLAAGKEELKFVVLDKVAGKCRSRSTYFVICKWGLPSINPSPSMNVSTDEPNEYD